jgi:hypothetical protein
VVYRKVRRGQELDLSDLVPLDTENEGGVSSLGLPILGATEYFERKKNTTVGTLAGTLNEAANVQLVQDGTELLGIAEDGIELARGIEPLT